MELLKPTPIKLKKKYRVKILSSGGKSSPSGSATEKAKSLGKGLWEQFRTKAPEHYKEEVATRRARVRQRIKIIGTTGRKSWRWAE